MTISIRQAIHWMFDIAVAFKAIDGALEIVGGYFLVFSPGWIGPAAASWAATMLAHDPASHFGHVLSRWGDGLTLDTEHFASSYLIAHGAAKVFIAWGLIREKLWAFPTALIAFGLLIVYQLYRLAHTHSPTLMVLITLDIAVCYLIWREYRFRRSVDLAEIG
ncbi:MAG: DUF2127 domain-containing protein [Betaproteobacteria bacterium]